MMTNQDTFDPVRVGIVGLGRSGWGIHANALAEMTEHFSIVAVCDPDQTRQDEANIRFGCRTYDYYTDFVDDDAVELVVVATPSQMHRNDAMEAMEAGKHVLVEKPMALTVAEVDEMMATAQRTEQILTANQNYRYAPDFLKIKEVIEAGVLGRILQMRFVKHGFSRRWDWQTLKEKGGGVLNNHGPHLIDWALLLIDDPEPEVIAQMETTPLYAGDADSHVKVWLRPKNGPLVDIELTHANAFPQDEFLVMATQGSLSGTRKHIRWRYFEPDDVAPLVLDEKPTPDRSYNSEELPWQEAAFKPHHNFHNEVRLMYRDLYQTIRVGVPLAITPESVRRQIAVFEKCRVQNGL